MKEKEVISEIPTKFLPERFYHIHQAAFGHHEHEWVSDLASMVIIEPSIIVSTRFKNSWYGVSMYIRSSRTIIEPILSSVCYNHYLV